MSAPNSPSFQEIIMRLQDYWAEHGCLIWQPYSEKVGAGTMNPATVLRVLGPEPWNVAYVEPSFRADDGRYGENPNRMQMHTQYQVILKPDPGNPQELYLGSLDAIGIDRRKHDIRFVEDNWEPRARRLGPGLGGVAGRAGDHPVHLFPAGGRHGAGPGQRRTDLRPGAHRHVPAGRQARSGRSRGTAHAPTATSTCSRRSSTATTTSSWPTSSASSRCTTSTRPRPSALGGRPGHPGARLRPALLAHLQPARRARRHRRHRAGQLLRPDARPGAADQRPVRGAADEDGVSVLGAKSEEEDAEESRGSERSGAEPRRGGEADLLLEIGCEELPVDDVVGAIQQLTVLAPQVLAEARLPHQGVRVTGTPRRLMVYVESLAGRQADEELVFRGPPVNRSFDAQGQATPAAAGFARSKGVDVADLVVREADGGTYVFAVQRLAGQPAMAVLPDLLAKLVASIRFEKSMRWDSDGIAFSRPLRWLVALFGEHVVPFSYAKAQSGRTSRGLRPLELAADRDPQRRRLPGVDGAERHRRGSR